MQVRLRNKIRFDPPPLSDLLSFTEVPTIIECTTMTGEPQWRAPPHDSCFVRRRG